MYTHNGNYLEETLRTATIKRQSSWDCRADGRTDLFIHIGRHYSYEHRCECKQKWTNNIINSYQSYERWTLQYNEWNRKNEMIRITELRRLQWQKRDGMYTYALIIWTHRHWSRVPFETTFHSLYVQLQKRFWPWKVSDDNTGIQLWKTLRRKTIRSHVHTWTWL